MTSIEWGNDRFALAIEVDDDAPPRIAAFGPPGGTAELAGSVGLVEVFHAADGHGRTNLAWQTSAVGERMRIVSHEQSADRLRLTIRDPKSGLEADWVATTWPGVPGFRAHSIVRNGGSGPVRLEVVTSLAVSLFAAADRDDLELHWARNEWLAEYRWTGEPIAQRLLMDIDVPLHGQDPRGRIAFVGRGTWSTGELLPQGVLRHRDRGRSFAWQVESSGAWSWELTERLGSVGVTLTGPTDHDSSWSTVLRPGESFETVPAAVVVSDDGLDGALGALTEYRRALRRPHPANTMLPIVYNTWMNTVGPHVTEETLLPLIDAAAEVGADVFCIDAGWYDNQGDRHDNLGEWHESRDRFPNGLGSVIAQIRANGMIPGLWLEPEVTGVDTLPARDLPDDAFFARGGFRLRDWGRYHLDLRHSSVRASLDATVDDLIARFGIGYAKLDYNVDFGSGTDVAATSLGEGALGHQRALHEWLGGILDRHPEFIVESCSSGAMRADYGMLRLSQLQSTSDQQSELHSVPIAAASPSAIVPEQAANWGYPQPEMSDERIVLALSNGILTRLYLSGWLDRMTSAQRRLVAEAVAAHRAVRSEVADAIPRWPLGLPGWTDEWIALAVGELLTVWHRGDSGGGIELPWPPAEDHDVVVEEVFPIARDGWEHSWNGGALRITSRLAEPSARTFRLRQG
ncbi:alpha-galactosidase [Agromyces sp. SYSU K20354]|uniref:glycoside hydrolase family 36 protein n=1 Tax=Agromyces cavernae TaxID=2898659 RepID=UPI001E4D0C5A|nr:alpha-galactosidase [Agromyces cavernae]MCD2443373.1 alpha-galactosidase [Agromyces cavernae]